MSKPRVNPIFAFCCVVVVIWAASKIASQWLIENPSRKAVKSVTDQAIQDAVRQAANDAARDVARDIADRVRREVAAEKQPATRPATTQATPAIVEPYAVTK